MAATMMTKNSLTVAYDSIEDLTGLCGPFTDDVIVKTLQQRYSCGRRLTRLGPTLLSVNTNSSSHGIRALVDTGSHEPELQTLADTLLLQLKDSGINQCLLLHGISGSGKTFVLHQVLRCLFSSAASLQTDAFKHSSAALTILQPLSTAATCNNPDSSRMAFRIEAQFADCALYHTKFDYLLFDQTRLHSPPMGERNFHIFYQFMDGLSPDEKEKLHLNGHTAQTLRYLTGYQPDEQETQWNQMRYNAWKLALAELGVPLSDIARVLAAILLLGNVAFVDADDAGPQQLELLGHRELKAAASLLGVSGPALFSALTQRRVHTGAACGSVTTDAAIASKVRDSLVRALYTQTLRILVRRFNTLKRPESSLSSVASSTDSSSEMGNGVGHPHHAATDSSASSTSSIGCVGGSIQLLDLGGFEAGSIQPQQQQQQQQQQLLRSRLDQLAANMAAERMQNWYERYALKEVAEAAAQEGIAVCHLGDFRGCDGDDLGSGKAPDDNGSLLLLLMHPRTGIAALINNFAKEDSTTSFMDALRQLHTVDDHIFQPNPPDRRCFGIRHTSNRVLYDSSDFISANNPVQQSALPFNALFQPKTCSFAFACYLFRASKSHSHSSDCRTTSKDATLLDQTVSFLRSCEASVAPCEKTFVLCLKPNAAGEPCLFDRNCVAQQCRTMRLVDTLDRLSCRLSHRLTFYQFERRVGFLLRATSLKPESMPHERCRALLNAFLHAVELHNLPYRDCKCAFGTRNVFFNEDFRQQLTALRLAIVSAEAAAAAVAKTVSVESSLLNKSKKLARPATVESPVRRHQSRAGQVKLRRQPQFGSCGQLTDLQPQKSQSMSDLRQLSQAFARPNRLFRKPDVPERKTAVTAGTGISADQTKTSKQAPACKRAFLDMRYFGHILAASKSDSLLISIKTEGDPSP